MTAPFDPPPEPPPLPKAGEKSASGRSKGEGEWHRQHPAACFFNILGTIRGMIFPIVFGVVAVRGPILILFLAFLFLITVGIAVLRYWRYRYRFTHQELVVEQGWLYRNIRHIAYTRVQNINIARNPVHRLFGVSGMQLESASGSEPEAVMEALSQSAIDELQERVEQAKSAAESGDEAELAGREPGDGEASEVRKPQREPRREILRLGVGELVRHGLISNRGMVLVAALIGFFFQGRLAERYLPGVLEWLERFTERVPSEIGEALGPFSWLLFGLGMFVVIMLALALLSVAYAIIRFYGFTLSVDSKNVRAEYGLFTRVAITIPKHRIQLIGFRSNPFHRLCRRVALKVETAGLTGAEENVSSLRWLAPIVPEGEVFRVLNEVQPEVEWDGFEWRPLHPRTRARLLRVRLMALGLATAALAFVTGVTGFLALLLVPLVLLYARGYFRYAGWAVTPTAVAFRSGWLVKQQSVVRYPKIQVVSMIRNPFDRRWGMAMVNADTAGADLTGHGVQIRFLDQESACELRDLLEEKATATSFAW